MFREKKIKEKLQFLMGNGEKLQHFFVVFVKMLKDPNRLWISFQRK